MEKIVCSAIQLKDGEIVTGLRHSHCYKTIFYFKKDWKFDFEIQGFINQKGEFKTREEALKIIIENNQEIRGDREFLKTQTILFSEDLY